jgi:hypothetical protein
MKYCLHFGPLRIIHSVPTIYLVAHVKISVIQLEDKLFLIEYFW